MKDKRLILKLKKNSAGALESIISKYSSYVYTVVYNIMSGRFTGEDIEEVVSDSFIKLWRNSAQLDEDKPLLPYLAAIAANTARSRFRSADKNTYCGEEVLENVAGEDFFETLNRSETVTAILNGVEECLGDTDRELFTRYYFYGEHLSEISKRLGLTLSNTKTRLCRARKKIREYLIQRGYSYGEK